MIRILHLNLEQVYLHIKTKNWIHLVCHFDQKEIHLNCFYLICTQTNMKGVTLLRLQTIQ